MKKAFQESKWWWYIPAISLFFIEEQADWAMKGTDRESYMKTMLTTLLLVLHVIFLIVSAVYIF